MRAVAVASAKTWLGTPYRHQASARGYGADCLGLVRGVWRELCGVEPVRVPPYTSDWSEAEQEERLWEAARHHLTEVARLPEPGDVLLFRMRERGVAKHLGILSASDATPRFIHAYQGHGVVESPFSAPWRRRAIAVFEFPR